MLKREAFIDIQAGPEGVGGFQQHIADGLVVGMIGILLIEHAGISIQTRSQREVRGCDKGNRPAILGKNIALTQSIGLAMYGRRITSITKYSEILAGVLKFFGLSDIIIETAGG